ncbi:amino acid adenylation domain-containing protein [Nocardia puris]|nr:non-ribosomal peptide synthetase [Nocardia puris]MBF6209658.1 amino acid adenylation domain-containing protein [Nocardia puris]MBF6366230.1 amino acid adenylation domain-containing protein [Nocardia puris]MBF6458431.1 amino acid adenylation domain-containing protein [Nocardia puris]
MQEKLGRPHGRTAGDFDWNRGIDALREWVGELAGVPVAALTDDTDLLALGLDSVTVMRISGLLRRAGKRVEYRDLVRSPTLGSWWKLLQDRDSEGAVETTAVDPAAPFPLAVMQHAFWIGRTSAQELGAVAAHLYGEFDHAGGLEPERLERAVRALMARHPMLRVTIDAEGMQRVTERGHWPGLTVHDLRALPEPERTRWLARTRGALSHRSMDVAAGEVFDLQLSLLPDGGTRVHLDLDMIAADALSLRNLLADLTALYTEGPTALPALGYSYQQYLADRAGVRAAAREQARAWWQSRLPELPAAPELPVLTSETATGGPRVDRRHHWLSPERAALLRERAHRAGLTTASVLATVFAETVGAWSRSDRFLLNLPVFDREPLHDEVDRLVGDFSSSVLLDVDLSAPMSVTERGRAITERLREALGYAAYTGVEVLRDLSRAQGGARVLAPVVYTSALSLGELYAPEVRECLGEPCWTVSQGPQVWLDAQVTEFDGGILLNWDARVSLFPPGMLDAMFGAYTRFVELLLNDDGAWDRAAPWPVTDRTYREIVTPPPIPLHRRFFARAEEHPDRTALIAGDAEITYGDLALRARRMAGLLAAKGIGRGDSVAITLPKGVDQIVAALGVLAVGATYVPSGVDVPPARRERVYRTAGARLVVTDVDTAATAPWPDDIALLFPEQVHTVAPLADLVAVDSEDVMYVIFTSGSTGTPKGVEVPHRAVAHTVDAVGLRFGIGADDRTIALSALDFDLSAYDLFAFLSVGGSVVVVEEGQRRDAAAWAELIRRWDVTVVSAVPALLDMLLIAAAETGLGTALRVVMLGGDRVTVDLPDRLRRLVPGCRFAGLGGMTEAAIHATVCEVDEVDPDWTSVPYGAPLPHASCRVVDGQGRDRPVWVPGELWVSGGGLAHGYRGDPERTAEKFVQRDGVRWYRTGDLVRYRPDGTLEFLGRTDHQVKIRGHRIELGEIEAVLAEHPEVSAAVAAVLERPTRALAAIVVGDADENTLREWLRDRLPRYMIPRRILRRTELPITRNGKVDRAAVHATLTAAGEHEGGDGAGASPRGPLERIVAEAWRELLGVDEIRRDHDFFTLGGDSLLATRLIRRLGAAGVTGAELGRLFTTPTLAEFAAHLAPGAAVAVPAIRPDPERRFEPFPLTDIQVAYWLGRSADFDLGGIPAQLAVEYGWPGVDVARLARAWRRVVDRHAMLRAVIEPDGRQRVLEEVPAYRIPVFDGPTESSSDEWPEERSDAGAWPPFDIRVIRDGESSRVLAVFDTVVVDGLSALVLLSEWTRLYDDPDLELPPLALEFRDYVTTCLPSDAEVQAALTYWRSRLPELPPGPQLPLRVSPAAVEHPRFRRREVRVESETWRRIVARARGYGVTPSVVLLACYTWVLGGWSAQRDLTVTLTRFDRRDVHPDIMRVVGDFSSLLLVADQPAAGESWLGRVRRLQEQLWRDLDHQQVSAVRVLRELARENDAPVEPVPVVFTSMLGVDDDLAHSVRWPDRMRTRTPQVWLDHQVVELPEGLVLSWDSVDELFPDGMVDAMLATYYEHLTRLADLDWDASLPDALPVLPARQRAVRDEVNMAGQPVAVNSSAPQLHTPMFDIAEADPDRVAIIDGSREVGFGELADHARRIAALLLEHGVRPGAAVAVSAARGVAQVAALYGVLAAGAAYVPVAKDQPWQRRNGILEQAEVSAVLTDDVAGFPDGMPIVPIAEASRHRPAPVFRGAPGDLAYVIFTSGSTGTPKGVEITHGSARNTLDDLRGRYHLGPGDRVLAVAATDFDLSVFDLFGVLGAGGSAVIVADEDRRDAAGWLAAAHAHGVTVWNSVPAMLDMLLTVAESGPGLPATLRLALVSGDWVGLDQPGRLVALSRDCRLVALGGATEASIWSNYFEVEKVDPEWTSIPYGRPLRNQYFRVVDESGRDRPDWVPGELLIGGLGVARGYRGDPELTAARFFEEDGVRWYRTGDLGRYRPDGVLEFLGRADRQVKVRGHRVELGEVEQAIAAHPEVRRAFAVAVGERSRMRLVAFVEPAVPEGLSEFVAERLPSGWLPELIALPDPPLTGNGKIDHAALVHRAESAGGARASVSEQGEPLRPGLETRIGHVWQEVLGGELPARDTSFFAAGGDSLSATRLVSRLARELGRTVTLREFFTNPTVAGLARGRSLTEATTPAPLATADPSRRWEPFPLTDIQVAYWLGRSPDFDLGGVGAQLYVEYDWPGVDVPRLARAWQRVVDRHAMLRAVLTADGRQRVLENVPAYRIPVLEGAQAPVAVREEMANGCLDATTWPLFDIRVVRDGERSRVCAVFDTLVVDGLSALVLIAEWTRLYDDPDLELPPLALEFRDYVTSSAPSEAEVRAALSYWRARLPELPPGPQLPLRVSPAAVERPRFSRREFRLDLDTWRRIVARARDYGVTPSVVLLSCYTWVLGGWSAQRDLTVTLTRFDRRDAHPDIMRVVGDFSSLLLVADRPAAGETWLSRARRLQEQLWSDLDHQQVSAVRVLRELARDSATMAEPVPVVFTSMLGVDDDLARSVRWPDHTRTQTPQVWLDHQVIELPEGVLLSWDSVDELFPEDLVDDMFARYRDHLTRLGDLDWEHPLPEALPVLPERQRSARARVNDTAGPGPEHSRWGGLLHAPLFDIAATDPGRVALIDHDDMTVGFGELADRAARIAALLREHGVRPGVAVAVSATRGAAQVAALYGVLAAGAVYVPVAKDQPPQRRIAILGQAQVSVVLTDDVAGHGGFPEGVAVVAISDASRMPPAPVHRGAPGDLAYVIFTSGSTGTPKGVEITHGSAVNTLEDLRCRYELCASDRVLAVAATDFDLSVFDLFGVLGAGGRAVLIADEDRRDAGRWLERVHQHGVTVWNSVPAMLDMLLTTAESGPGLPATLRLALVSGDWVGLDLPGRLAALSQDCRLIALGGATEASIWSNYFEVEKVDPEWTSIPYGRPLRNQRYRVVDESGHDRPDWVPGELLIGGLGVAHGYRGDPELTRSKFSEADGVRWYRTGDLGRYRPDGVLEFLGRADRQVKVRGHRVELGEVEQAIAAHPEVRRAFAVAVGERSRMRLVAFVEPAVPEGLSEFVAERLPSGWLPELIALPDPPLTGNGKIDHAALVHRAQTSTGTAASGPAEPLRPGLETRIGRLWQEIVGGELPGRDTSFFAAGGDSLSATRLLGRLHRELGVTTGLREFFTTPTIAGLTRNQPQNDLELEEGAL